MMTKEMIALHPVHSFAWMRQDLIRNYQYNPEHIMMMDNQDLTCRIAKDEAGSPHPSGWISRTASPGELRRSRNRMKAESFAPITFVPRRTTIYLIVPST